jgi:hypothetical protein
MSTPLTPAAQKVLDAFNGYDELVNRRIRIAAVLRAVAEEKSYTTRYHPTNSELNKSVVDELDILAIADELEGQP